MEHYAYPTLKLEGLNENAMYKLTAFEGRVDDGSPVVASGAYWMNRGLDPALNGDFHAAGFVLEEVAGK
jgi:alpha-galactosidase